MKKDFKGQVKKNLKPTSMAEFMNGDNKKETKPKKSKSPKKGNVPKTFSKEKPSLKEAEIVKEEVEKERHEVRLEADLSDKIHVCIFENRKIKLDKTKLFKLVLTDFFNKSKDQQLNIVTKGMKKL